MGVPRYDTSTLMTLGTTKGQRRCRSTTPARTFASTAIQVTHTSGPVGWGRNSELRTVTGTVASSTEPVGSTAPAPSTVWVAGSSTVASDWEKKNDPEAEVADAAAARIAAGDLLHARRRQPAVAPSAQVPQKVW
jgi:hypothetical protein